MRFAARARFRAVRCRKPAPPRLDRWKNITRRTTRSGVSAGSSSHILQPIHVHSHRDDQPLNAAREGVEAALDAWGAGGRCRCRCRRDPATTSETLGRPPSSNRQASCWCRAHPGSSRPHAYAGCAICAAGRAASAPARLAEGPRIRPSGAGLFVCLRPSWLARLTRFDLVTPG
jgi:hypothetical protein